MTSPAVAEPEVAAPDAVPERPETAPPAVEAPPSPEPQPRDDAGRFAKAEAPAEAAPEGEPPSKQPADAAVEQPVEQPPDEGADTAYPEVEYQVGDQVLSIPGSKRGDDGIFIPAAQLESHFGLVAAGHTAQRTINQLKRDHGRELATVRKEVEQEKGKLQTILAELAKVMEEPDDQKAFAVFAGLKKNWPVRLAKAEADALRKRLEETESGLSDRELDDNARALVPRLQDAARGYIAEYAKRPEFQGVDTDRIYRLALGRYFDDLFAEDDSGEIIVHHGVIEELMRDEAAILARAKVRDVRGAPSPPKKPIPPPTVTTKAGPAPGKAIKAPEFKTGQEAWEWVERGGHLQE